MTHRGNVSLQVFLAQVGRLITDGLLSFLHGAAQLTAAGLEFLQELQQDAALLLPVREGTSF